jgi:hypothetical protein
MINEDVPVLLAALEIAVFERNSDGSFRSVATPPAWFARLGRDGTFPFLGHILEEAIAFWAGESEGVATWGPCADVSDDGKEFHYLVKALNVNFRKFLVFQLDESAERVRDVLQKVRSDALDKTRGH